MNEEPHNLILERLRELREEQKQLIADVRVGKNGHRLFPAVAIWRDGRNASKERTTCPAL